MAEPLREPGPASVRAEVQVPLRLTTGKTSTATLVTFEGLADDREHLAVRLGRPSPDRPPLVRLHSECLTGDLFGSTRCDCGPQLAESIERISIAGGYLLYLRQEGRGIGLYAKLDAYGLQDRGLDTYQANQAMGYPADARDYTPAAQMLIALGAWRIELLSSNPDKAGQLTRLGIEITTRTPTRTHRTPANARYLATKARVTGHDLDLSRFGEG